jgi:flagellar motor switch protein FliG
MKKLIKPMPAYNLYTAALAALILFFSGSVCRAAEVSSRSSIEGKLALESSLEKRIQMVLSEALGTGDIIVIISAELQEEQKKQAFDFLPGIPEKEKVGERSLSSSLTMIKKISATLILDRALPAEDFKLAKKLAAGLLGLPPEREDLITVEKMDFRKARPFTPADLILPPNLWNLIWTLLAAVFGIFTIFAFLKPFAISAKDLVGVLGAKTGGTQEQIKNPELLAAAPAENKPTDKKPSLWLEPPRKSPFWFLTPERAGNLAFILRARPVEDITIVLSYASEAVAAALVEALYPKSIEALAGLPKVTLMPEARIKGLETELFSALDYVVGSEEKTISIIEQLPENMQEKASVSFSAHNPEFAARLSGAIVRFSDIRELEPAQAQMLMRRVPIRSLALALKNSDLARVFLEKLSAGMQERFQQELDLTRKPSPEIQRSEKMRTAQELKKLIQEGFITLKKAALNPAPPPPPEPAAHIPAQEAQAQDAFTPPPPPPVERKS